MEKKLEPRPGIHNIGILASGSGSTAESFIRAWQDDDVKNADVKLIIASRPKGEIEIYDRIDKLNEKFELNIPILHISGKTHPGGPAERGQTDEESQAITDALINAGVEFVFLLGYMRIVRGALLEQYGWQRGMPAKQGRLGNFHPAILPQTADTFGVNAAQKVLDLGIQYNAFTAHLVSKGVDEGPKLGQVLVPVKQGDTAKSLFSRTQAVEKIAGPIIINRFINGELFEGDRLVPMKIHMDDIIKA